MTIEIGDATLAGAITNRRRVANGMVTFDHNGS